MGYIVIRVTFIQCRPKDVFKQLDALLAALEEQMRDTIATNCWSPSDVMLTISAEPAEKELVYRMAKRGYW